MISVLPIIAIVAVLCLFLVPMQPTLLLTFLVGALMIVVGLGLFSLGAERSMTIIGSKIGTALTKIGKLPVILLVAFALGVAVTVAEPDLQVLADTVPNHVLEALLHRNFAELGVPGHTAEELAFADALSRTYEGAEGIPGIGSKYDPAYAQNVKALRAEAGHAMNDFLLPLYSGEAFRPGSTDVGDVSWECPTAQISVAAWPNGCPGHSWQNVSCDGTDIGRKAAVHAGKVIAAAAIDLFADPSILDAARAEFAEKTAEGYTCPIPADAVPAPLD